MARDNRFMNRERDHSQTWPPSWLDPVRRRVRRWCVTGAGTSWVVAVSGGGDSVGLLRVLHFLAPELGLRLSVAHLNHGVREEHARADAAHVEEMARELGLPFDLGHWRPERTGHFEADARKARYGWLREIAVERGATAVAVGHTLDDQAETILHRIVRGTGPRGLSGMPFRRVLCCEPPIALIRPLLRVSRQAIRESLDSLGQGFREDDSNADLSRTRARLRHNLMPRLAADYNPRVVEAIARLGMLAGSSVRVMERWLIELEHDLIRSTSRDRIELRRDRLLLLPLFLRAEVLRRIWREAGWPEAGMSAKRWRRLGRQALSERIITLYVGGGIALSTTGLQGQPPDGFILERTAPVDRAKGMIVVPQSVPLDVPGIATWGADRIISVLKPQGLCDEIIDLDRLSLPLQVRPPAPGDRFAPLGMEGKSTPLNDFFRGRKVARDERRGTLLLCDAEGIIWVVGHRIAERVKVTEQTRNTLGVCWERGPANASEGKGVSEEARGA
jgi:tRNA(Ile)-lysidine synthase